MLEDIDTLVEQLRRVLRIAGYTNQRDLARRLADLLTSARKASVDIVLIGKRDGGGLELGDRLEAALPRVHAIAVEASDYTAIGPDIVTRATNSAAILLAVPALAPFFDETEEFLTRQFGAVMDKVMLAVVGEETCLPVELPESLRELSCYTQDEIVAAVSDRLARTQLRDLETEMRTQIRTACDRLLPVVATFADFLSMSQAQYLRQLDFIRKDVNGLQELAQKARQVLETQARRATSDLNEAGRELAQTMRQQAETTVYNTPFPKEILADQEKRNTAGRTIVAAARAAGYREFETRVQSLAMNLNSARSVLLSGVDELRAEAQARWEELSLNLGPELLTAWLVAASPSWPEKPLEFSLDAGAGFPELVMEAARQVREAIPDLGFSSTWAARIEGVYRAEMIAAAQTGWKPEALDIGLVLAVAQKWKDAAERGCGMLIARLEEIVRTASSGLASCRLDALALPKDDSVRGRIAEAYRGFGEELRKMRGQVS